MKREKEQPPDIGPEDWGGTFDQLLVVQRNAGSGTPPQGLKAMMRTPILVASLLAATSSLAETLPISGIYGDPGACRLYAEGGIARFSESNGIDDLLVTPAAILGEEWGCEPEKTVDHVVHLLCAMEGSTYQATATFQEDIDAGTLILAGTNVPPATLSRCKSPAPTTIATAPTLGLSPKEAYAATTSAAPSTFVPTRPFRAVPRNDGTGTVDIFLQPPPPAPETNMPSHHRAIASPGVPGPIEASLVTGTDAPFVWSAYGNELTVRLSYGILDSDAVSLILDCVIEDGTGQLVIPEVLGGIIGIERVRLKGPLHRATFAGLIESNTFGAATSLIIPLIAVGDALAVLRGTGIVRITGSSWYRELPLNGSVAEAIAEFERACPRARLENLSPESGGR